MKPLEFPGVPDTSDRCQIWRMRKESTMPGSVIAFVEDPDGHKIEFIQRA